MWCFKYLFLILVHTMASNAVRINMKGSLNLGEHIMETFTHYLQTNNNSINRRLGSEMYPNDSEKLKWVLSSANLCGDLDMCKLELGGFIIEYVSLIATTVESVLESVPRKDKNINLDEMFIEKLKDILININNSLIQSDFKISVKNVEFEWLTLIKKISAKYQKGLRDLVTLQFAGTTHAQQMFKKNTIQKLTIAIILVELQYENQLCVDHEICETEHECTKTLVALLHEFQSAPIEKAKDFIKAFYESLPDPIFSFLRPDTTHEFQVILSDLSYTLSSPIKDVLISVLKTVDNRLKFLKTGAEMSKAFDQQLVNVILSDMDYFYTSKRKTFPFDNFMGPFSGWLRTGGKLNPYMAAIIKDLQTKLSEQPTELVEKLSNEVKVFLELTVDPEH